MRMAISLRGTLFGLSILLTAALPCGSRSQAAITATWDGSQNTGTWADGANWDTDPTVPGSTDTAIFNSAGGTNDTIDFGAGVTIKSISFDTASAAAYILGSGANGSQTLTLNGGGDITMSSTVGNNQQIRSNITLGTDGTAQNFFITNNSTTRSMTIGNALTIRGTASAGNTSTLTLSTAAGGMSLFGGNNAVLGLSDGLNGGKLALIINGTGTVTLGNASSNENYTGGTYINQGTYLINANGLPANTSLYIANGTSFGGSVNASTLAGITSQWNGNWTFTGISETFSGGTVDLGAAGTDSVRTVTASASTLTVNSVMSNGTNGFTTGFTKAGTGAMSLTGLNTYTGRTSVTAGTLSLNNIGNVGVATSAGRSVTVSDGTISISTGVTAATLSYVGSGDTSNRVLDLTSTTGGVTLDQSGTGEAKFTSALTATGAGSKNLTLQGSSAGFGQIAGAIVDNSGANKTSVIKNGTGTWVISGTNTYTGGTTLTQGDLAVSASANLGDSTAALTFNGGTLRIDGTALSSVSGLGHSVSFAATKLVGLNIVDPAHTFTVDQVLNQTTGGLTKTGFGTLALTKVNTYTGTTTLNAGTLVLKDTAAGLTQTLGGLALAGPDVTLQSNNAGGGTLSTTFGTLTARTSGNTANIVSTGGANGTSNILNITGAAGFIDKGIFFNGAEYAARNTVNGYVRALAYGTDANTVAVNTITANNHVKLTATPVNQNNITLLSLNLAGSTNVTLNASQALTLPAIIKSGGGTSTISALSGNTAVAANAELVIRTDTASDILDINGTITGTQTLTKSGAGTLRLSGSTSNALGTLTVNGGTLELNKSAGSAIQNANPGLNINNGALVKYTGSSTDMIAATGAGTNGQININGTGQLDFNGKTDTLFNIVITSSGASANTTPIKNSGSGGGLATNGLVFTPVDGWTTLVDTGSGTLTLNNNGTTFSSPSFGQAQISGNLALSATRNFNINTGGGAGYDMLVDAVVSSSGGPIKNGVGTLRFTGANTYTGVTTINAGTLAFNSIQNAGSGTANALGTPTVGNSTIGLASSGTLQYIGSSAGSSNRVINLSTAGGGTFTLDASGSATFALSGNITTAGTSGTSTLTLAGSGAGSHSGTIVNGSGTNLTALTKTGTGTWTLSGANTFTGKTIIESGILSATTLNNVAAPLTNSNLGRPTTVANGTIDFGVGVSTGQLTYTGTGETTDRVISLTGTTGGATIDQSGTGLLKFTSNLAALGTASQDNQKTLVLQGSSAGTGEIAGIIVNSTLGNVGQLTISLTKAGTGTWTLSGNNTYTGATNVNAGKLLINGNQSAATGAVNVAAIATLGGIGTIGGDTTILGTHSPGNSPGIETFASDLTYDGGASDVIWELIDDTNINAANPNAIFDTILVGGNLAFDDLTALTLTFNVGSTVDWNDAFWGSSHTGVNGWLLYDVAGTTSGFSNLSLTTANWLDGSNTLDFNTARPNSSFSLVQIGQDVYLNYALQDVPAVPEPGTFVLSALGLVVLGTLAWRKRNSSRSA